MSKLHWEELTNSDILVTERESVFVNDINMVKICYITDGRNFFTGVDDKLRFFVNNVSYDFKLNQQPLRFFQYKTARQSLLTNAADVLHIVGIETEDSNAMYRYAITVAADQSVIVNCSTIVDDNVVDQRSIQLGGSRVG